MVRFKNRYITMEVISPSKKTFSEADIHKELMRRIQEVYGDYGTALVRTGLTTSYCNELTRILIIRVRHGPHTFVTTTLPLIHKIGREIAKVRIIYVGATLRHCYKNVIRYQKSKIDSFVKNAKTEEEKQEIESNLLKLGGMVVSTHSNSS